MNLYNLISSNDLKNRIDQIKKIFFYRICGTGMGAAAVLLKEKGFNVEGGDLNFYPPMSDYLKQTNIPCHNLKEINPEFLKTFDLIVVGNVVPKRSSDARMIEELSVPFISFPSVLGALVLSNTNVVGIAGTHGKTTTTYLITQLFENLGFNPGYMVGGVIEGRPSARLGDGKYFFIESDEYDSAYFEKISKFRRYEIDHLILTSLEFDHADIFLNLDQIKQQFCEVIPQVTSSYIFSADYEASIDLYNRYKGQKKWQLYGEKSKTGPSIVKMNQQGTVFKLLLNDKLHTFKTNLMGKHNILNLSSAIMFAHMEGIEIEQIAQAVTQLSLVKRRQEVRGTYKNAIVIDDFAHHPRAITTTIDSIKIGYPTKKINVIFEPNSATARSSIFQDEFPNALKSADIVIVAKPIKPTTVEGKKDLDCDKIIKDLNSLNRKAYIAVDLKQLQTYIDSFADANSVFLILSNGTCLGLWESTFVSNLI
ncbi:MAG: hypothetical protein ISR65_01800 [Bacteriovoracaceae bacterium]|nr:hypothetical protein [Bacteriovoracaceae bacterium]